MLDLQPVTASPAAEGRVEHDHAGWEPPRHSVRQDGHAVTGGPGQDTRVARLRATLADAARALVAAGVEAHEVGELAEAAAFGADYGQPHGIC